jgi:hypothetical protein
MSTRITLFEAIALRKCVTASYNRTTVKLAPHILYTRHDELFVDAVTVERDGQAPREMKFGTFKLDGLKDLLIADRMFDVADIFNLRDPRYDGTTLLAVEAVTRPLA